MKNNLSNSKYSEELETAFRAASEAGEIIDKFAEEGFETDFKGDGSRVTEADRRSQEKIVEVISENFPEDGFLGEEDNLTPNGEDRVWVIDPIDGTFNYDRAFSHYCVSISLKIEGEVVLGLVYSPESSMEDTYLALKYEGAYRTSLGLDKLQRISVSNHDEIESSVFFLSSFDIYEDELQIELSILEDLARKDAVHRNLGSCALEMCLVASGEAEIQIVPLVSEWDYAAAKLIIEEAGGEVRIRDSKFPNSTEVVSTNGNLQDRVEDIIGEKFIK